MIDADSVPQAGVKHLFESEQFARTGQLFWPDIWGSISNSFSSTAESAGMWPFVGVLVAHYHIVMSSKSDVSKIPGLIIAIIQSLDLMKMLE